MRKKNSKKKRQQNLLRTIEEYISGKKFKPSTLNQIAKNLNLEKEQYKLLGTILNDLQKKGIVTLQKSKYYKHGQIQALTTKGVLHLHPRGFGFVEIKDDQCSFKEVFIPKTRINDAVDEDLVEVQIHPNILPKGPEGEITTVLQRGRTHLSGTVCDFEENCPVAFSSILGNSKKIYVTGDVSLEIGDRVQMEVQSWSDDHNHVRAKFVQKIGHINDPSCDNLAVIEEFELHNLFPQKLQTAAKQFKKTVPESDLKNRKDFTDLTTFTIDPESAKDFDDALSITKGQSGHYTLIVHIADVAHYIKQSTLLDKEAYERANSTYLPNMCVPMLPFELSNGLCSLKPNVIRLCQSVVMHFDSSGHLLNYEIVRSFIKSQKRFTYQEALDVIEGRKKSMYASDLKEMVNLCHLLKKHRFERGSIDFSLPEARLEVNEMGEPQKIHVEEYDISHQLVEEFMLKANEIVAAHLSKQDKAMIYRVHEKPSEEHMSDFFTLLKGYGFRIGKTPSQKEIQLIFLQAKDSPYWKEISVAFIKSMKLASYSCENLGHYGLCLEYYCHFTSPIRRYADLVVQRQLFSDPVESDNLQTITTHLSSQERKSMKAENTVILLKKLRLLSKEDPNRVYLATITKIKPFAIFFDIIDYFMESSVHIGELKKDYFIYHPRLKTLSGKHTKLTYRCGEQIVVKLIKVDLIRLTSKFEIIKKVPRKK